MRSPSAGRSARGSRDDVDSLSSRTGLDADLTDKRQAALETAYYAGFSDWPRESTDEQVAETLDVSAPTFHKHLRVAKRKRFAALFGDEWTNE